MGQRNAFDKIGNGCRLGAIRFQKLQTRRGRIKQIRDLDLCAGIEGYGAQRRDHAPIHHHHHGLRIIGATGLDGEPRDRADGGQSLAAKAQRFNGKQIAIG